MQLFTLVTGVIYIVLEIRQDRLVWGVGILTSLAAMWVFFRQGLYASFGLNAYYLVTAFIGLWQWGRDRKRMRQASRTEDEVPGGDIHLNPLSWKTVISSAVVSLAGIFALAWLMELVENPMSYMDSTVTVLSAVATWWLVRAYIQQWWLWIVADTLSAVMCAGQGLWWMALLYAMYALSAVYGYIHWKRHGRYI